VPSRGDRFVIRSYSPARTIGGGTIIEPVAQRRRRHAGLETLAVRERGSLEARALERLEAEASPVPIASLARALSEGEATVAQALESLRGEGAVVAPWEGRWLSAARWQAARGVIMSHVEEYARRHPARFGVPKGELKSALKTSVDSALFDAAFESLATESQLAVKSERVRPAGDSWEPPAATLAALEQLESGFDAGYAVPENREWQGKLGAQAAEVMALGVFLERLVRVSQDLTYSARQLESLRTKIREHFAKKPTLDVADFKTLTGASRKYAVPLLEFMDRSGWTVRAGDVRKPGGRLAS
jgi:selenocysteine-specific elongation factor